MPEYQIKIITDAKDLEAAFEIRRKVFRVEQGVSEAEEFDGLDNEARQYLLWLDEIPVGTARSRQLDQNTAKVERVAVLADARGRGFGHDLMLFVMQDLKENGISAITVNAQAQVIPFYIALNFVEVGAEFIEAGIRHKKMIYEAAKA